MHTDNRSTQNNKRQSKANSRLKSLMDPDVCPVDELSTMPPQGLQVPPSEIVLSGPMSVSLCRASCARPACVQIT